MRPASEPTKRPAYNVFPISLQPRSATLTNLDLGVEDLFYHALAVLQDPAYRRENAGALRMEWPRIPLPGWTEFSAPALGRGGSRTAPTVAVDENAPSADQSVMPPQAGIQTPTDAADSAVMPAKAGFQTPTDAADPSVIPVKTRPVPGRGIHPAADAAQSLAASAARGRQLAHLLDSDTPVPGVTTGTLRPEIAAHRRARHHGRPQHDRQRLCPHRRLGALWQPVKRSCPARAR